MPVGGLERVCRRGQNRDLIVRTCVRVLHYLVQECHSTSTTTNGVVRHICRHIYRTFARPTESQAKVRCDSRQRATRAFVGSFTAAAHLRLSPKDSRQCAATVEPPTTRHIAHNSTSHSHTRIVLVLVHSKPSSGVTSDRGFSQAASPPTPAPTIRLQSGAAEFCHRTLCIR